MPGGNLFKSTDTNLDIYFGICYATVEVLNSIYNPILQYKDISDNNYNPTGSWSGFYYCEMLKAARDSGINISVHSGYKFDRIPLLFDDYVDHNFQIKAEAKELGNKGLYQLSKLMSNSIYDLLKFKSSKSLFKKTNNFLISCIPTSLFRHFRLLFKMLTIKSFW